MFLFGVFVSLLLLHQTQAKAVFAHFMVTNAGNYSTSDYMDDIRLAQEAHIDAFVLNMGNEDPVNDAVVSRFFSNAESLGFKLLFSFDYASNGAWDQNLVINMIRQYSASSAYYFYNGQPFVSTFEGPANATDWLSIKGATGCFFMPDWSSLGAKPAAELNVADGLFSWAAWPWGNEESNTYVDASYLQYLGGLPYMMPASPWFFTNLPGFGGKNWLWRGDNLWYDRWQEIWYLQPPFVEIISWNDYGESHYIGPLRDYAMAAFIIGNGPYNYAADMPHDGWRLFLPYVIDMYKNGIATVTKEGLTAWHRPQPARACNTGDTSGNTASQFQVEFEPYDLVEDAIFFTALLGSSANVRVTVGGQDLHADWTWRPDGGIGLYHGSVAYGSHLGDVVVTISRPGNSQIAQVTGGSITTTCTNDIENWNAWVGSDSVPGSISATPTLSLFDQVCINGTGTGNFEEICSFGCKYAYCPVGACYCQLMGRPSATPTAVAHAGYALAGEDASYSGLCAFDCAHGNCPSSACGTVSAPLSTPTVSDFLPLACTSGEGPSGALDGLCGFACAYGYCPIIACTCLTRGALPALPERTNQVGRVADGYEESVYGPLCTFACEYGWCPGPACYAADSTSSGTGSDSGAVYIDPIIWIEPSPIVGCFPPCTIVFPESTMNTPTTIYFPPVTTSLVVGTSTITTLYPAPITTSIISFFNMPVDGTQTDPYSMTVTSSFDPPPVTITVGATTTTIYFLPIASPSTPSGIVVPSPTSLGTTDYVLNGETQTFSKAQLTDLRTIRTPTVASLDLTETLSGTSITVLHITVSVQTGGFYWSPIPSPTGPPIVIPAIPELPPIPTAECFTLFDIFSIDCPPNKKSATTTFSSASPTPTCTGSGCGKFCTTNCETTGSSEECSTQTATDYFVSCTASSCETTSTRTVTGCYVTNSATTTGNYCPVVSMDPLNDDEGQDGTLPTTTTVYTTSVGETGIVSGTPYPVSGGRIIVGGVTLPVPTTVTTGRQPIVTVSGVVITIIPGYVGRVTAYNGDTDGTVALSTTTLPPTTTTTTATVFPTATSYDCRGSIQCGDFPGGLEQYCRTASTLFVADDWYGTTEANDNTGTCDTSIGELGCGIFVQGTGCQFSGSEILATWNDIHSNGGCHTCGNAHFANGCRVTVNYVSTCATSNYSPARFDEAVILKGTIPNNSTFIAANGTVINQ